MFEDKIAEMNQAVMERPVQAEGFDKRTYTVDEIQDILEISRSDKKEPGKRMSRVEKEKLIAALTAEMRAAAKILEFEHAAYLRDKIEKLRNSK